MTTHKRRCHDCGNEAEHDDNVIPWVLCSKCGSQDTRATQKPIRVEITSKPAVITKEAFDLEEEWYSKIAIMFETNEHQEFWDKANSFIQFGKKYVITIREIE